MYCLPPHIHVNLSTKPYVNTCTTPSIHPSNRIASSSLIRSHAAGKLVEAIRFLPGGSHRQKLCYQAISPIQPTSQPAQRLLRLNLRDRGRLLGFVLLGPLCRYDDRETVKRFFVRSCTTTTTTTTTVCIEICGYYTKNVYKVKQRQMGNK